LIDVANSQAMNSTVWNQQKQMDEWWTRGTVSWWPAVDRRWRRPATSETGTQQGSLDNSERSQLYWTFWGGLRPNMHASTKYNCHSIL